MKLRVKALTAEIEIELQDEKDTIAYRSENLKDIINKAKISVIEIEKELFALNVKSNDQ